jgi:hypothetical protein
MPTAHPTMRPMLIPEASTTAADEVVTMVSTTVTVATDPDETLVRTVEIGLAEEIMRDDTAGEEPASIADDGGAVSFNTALRVTELDTNPVIDARLGALDAWLLPIVAYGLPS